MWTAVKPKFLKCKNDQCSKSNPLTVDVCVHCGQHLEKQVKYAEKVNSMIPSKMTRLVMLDENMHHAATTLNSINGDLLNDDDKYNFMVVATDMAIHDCEQCIGFLDFLIAMGQEIENNNNEPTDEQRTQVAAMITTIRPHIEQYINDGGAMTVRWLIQRANIHQLIPHYHGDDDDYEDIGGWEELPGDWYVDFMKPANQKEIDLIEPLNDQTVEEGEMCVICMDELKFIDPETGEMLSVVALPCKHMFHDVCIKAWFTKCNKCPIGRCLIKKN